MNILDIEERRIKLPKAESYEVQDKKIRLEILKKKLSDPELLEFEKAQIRANIKELEHSIKAEGLNVTKMDSRYDRIDMDYVEKIRIFSKSLGKYVPRFAIYKLNDPKLKMIIKCQCDHHLSKDVYETNVYPSELNQDNYSDIMGETLLTRICKSYFSEENEVIKYTHEFKGLFPDEVRKIIKECGFQLDQLFLIEESYAWNCTVERINPDPIIVGLYQNYFYYICSFDITSMEQFVLTEKTTHV